MKTVDMNSEEFKTELEKTWKFVKKVNSSRGWVQNPNEDGLCHCGIFCTPEYVEAQKK